MSFQSKWSAKLAKTPQYEGAKSARSQFDGRSARSDKSAISTCGTSGTSISEGFSNKKRYNVLLSRFKALEALVEASPDQGLAFKGCFAEWVRLGDQLTEMLHKIGPYTQNETLHGFSCGEVANER